MSDTRTVRLAVSLRPENDAFTDAEVAADLKTLIGEFRMDTPYEVTDVQLLEEDRPGAPDTSSPEYRAGWASEDEDQAMIEAARQRTEAEIALEDMSDEQIALASLRGRVVHFLGGQPDVADLEDLGDGIYGFRLAGTNGISMVVQLTQ